MSGPARIPTAIRQVSVLSGDLDKTLAFWRDFLGLPTHARFDPPGIAFIVVGGVRLYFNPGSKPATVYLDVEGLETVCADLERRGATLTARPALLHRDRDGQFGPAGEEEWMAFLNDPAGNTIGLVERRWPADAMLGAP